MTKKEDNLKNSQVLVGACESKSLIGNFQDRDKIRVSTPGVFSYIVGRFDSLDDSGKKIQDDVKEIKDSLIKKKRVKKERLPLRDPLTNVIFKFLLEKPIRKKERRLNYSRYRLAVTLLWAAGLRVNEVRRLKKEDIETLLREKKLSIYQEKVNNYRDVYFSENALKVLEGLESEIKLVFKSHEFLAGGNSKSNWINFINNRLKRNLEGFNFNIKSHSFRVNYVTQVLRKLPLHEAQKLVGHRDVRTTLLYDRYSADVSKVKSVLNEIQDLSIPLKEGD